MMFNSTKQALNNFLHDLNKKKRLLEINKNDIDIIKSYIFTKNTNLLKYDKKNFIKGGDLIGFDDDNNMIVVISRISRTRNDKKILSSRLLYLKGNLISYSNSKQENGVTTEQNLDDYISKKLPEYFEGERIFKLIKNDKNFEFVIARNVVEAKKKTTQSRHGSGIKKIMEVSSKEYKAEIDILEKEKEQIQTKIDMFKSIEDQII